MFLPVPLRVREKHYGGLVFREKAPLKLLSGYYKSCGLLRGVLVGELYGFRS